MQEISLIKRILLYGLLSLIFLIVEIGASIFYHEIGIIIALFIFSIPHYIWGLIFLKKTKWFLKLIVPFATTIVSFGSILLLGGTCNLDMPRTILMLSLPNVFSWEIAYQMLIKCLNKNSSSQNQMSEL